MFKKTKLALSAVTALLALSGLVVAPLANADNMAQLQARIAKLEKQETKRQAMSGSNMVYFRGGYAENDYSRYGETLTDTRGLNGQENGKKEGWYIGAGLDLVLSNDLFGLDDSIEVLGEIMFEYKEFDKQDLSAAPLASVVDTVTGETVQAARHGGGDPIDVLQLTPGSGSVQVGQFTLTAAPKVKFMRGNKFRPWVIPVGLAIHVISPPSNGVTVIEPGIQFAAGADYNIWSNIFVGADVRYNLAFGDLDGTNVGGVTTGVYAGFGF